MAGAPRPRVAALEWLDPPYVGGHWVPEMIALAGGEDVLGLAGEQVAEAAWEELRRRAPEIAVVMPCGLYADEAAGQARGHASRSRPSAPSGVVAVDAASSFSRPGPRLVDGVELLATSSTPATGREPAGRRLACGARLHGDHSAEHTVPRVNGLARGLLRRGRGLRELPGLAAGGDLRRGHGAGPRRARRAWCATRSTPRCGGSPTRSTTHYEPPGRVWWDFVEGDGVEPIEGGYLFEPIDDDAGRSPPTPRDRSRRPRARPDRTPAQLGADAALGRRARRRGRAPSGAPPGSDDRAFA